jgi:hypothetical protein
MTVDDGTDECVQVEGGAPRNMSILKGKPAQRTKKRRGNRGEVAATGIVETGKEALMINNIGIQPGDPEEDDNRVANCTSTLCSQPPAAPANEELAGVPPVTSELGSAESPVLPCYSVGRGISLPFGQVLPQCSHCSCKALIAWSNRSNPKENGLLCLDHGLVKTSNIRELSLPWFFERPYRFISPEYEAALREFLA